MEQTEQKHSKKQTSCRDQRDKSRKTTKRPGRKISFLRKLHNKSSLQQEYKKGRKAALAWKKEVISSSSPSGCFFFPHKSARAKSGESVFLIVGKYHLWYLTLNARYSVTSGRKRGGDRAWCARIFCAGKGGGVFRFLSSRRTSYQSLLVRFGFGRR